MTPRRRAAWRASLRRLGTLASVVLLSCVDGTGPTSLGQLRIRPVFAPGEEPESLGVAPSSIHIVIRRTGGSVAADTTLPYHPGDVTSWLIEMEDTPESMTVDAALGQGAAALYSGSGEVSLDPGIGPASTSTDVPVQYVGTTAAFTVDVDPDSIGVDSPGETAQFAAVARDAAGDPLSGFSFSWSSTHPDVATVNSTTGEVTAIANGRTEIVASSGGVDGSATLTVGVPPVDAPAAILVAPSAATLFLPGATQQFSATVVDGRGVPIPGVPVTWSSSNDAVASITSTSGLATAVSSGTVSITASAAGLEGVASLVVDFGPGGVPTTIVVTPGAASLTVLGSTQQFQAVALDVNGAVVPGITFDWSTTAPDVATVDANGTATALQPGEVQVVAAAAGVSGASMLTVAGTTDGIPQSIEVTPTSAATSPGGSAQFDAVALNASGETVPNVQFTWSVVDPSVATIDATGRATAVAPGVTEVTASLGTLSGSSTLIVTVGGGGVASIIVSPAPASLTGIGATRQFTAVALDGTGAVIPGVVFLWTSSDAAVATIDQTGLATSTGAGAATISASALGRTGISVLTVSLTSTPVAVVVTPGAATISGYGSTQQFSAIALDGQGNAVPGVSFTWATSDSVVATIDASGLAVGQSIGATTVTASTGQVSGSASLQVTQGPGLMPAYVLVIPSNATLTTLGAQQQFLAAAFDPQGHFVPGVTFTWSSSAPAIATVGASTGTATAHAAGTVIITASGAGHSGAATLVVAPSIATVDVAPLTLTIGVGDSVSYTAVARDAGGTVVPGVSFTWSADPAVATIRQDGVLNGVAAGSSAVLAAAGGATGSAMVDVVAVGTITIAPSATLERLVGSTVQYTATVRDTGGNVVPVRVTWSVSDPLLASVDQNGLVTGLANGIVAIRASAGGVTAQVLLELLGSGAEQ